MLCNLPIFITISNNGASAPYSSFPILNLMTGAISTAASGDSRAVGEIFNCPFECRVRADISRISIELFDVTLQKWCGSENPQLRRDCQACDWHRLCPHAREETPDSVLCAGYQAFYSYSAPHMRVMRDLIKQHRSPQGADDDAAVTCA